MKLKKIIIAYTPVLHRGYLDFFMKFGKGNTLLIPNKEVTDLIEYIWRDMRAMSQEEIMISLWALNSQDKNFKGTFSKMRIVGIDSIIKSLSDGEVIMPEEDISLEIKKLLPKDAKIRFVSAFLRWNNFNVLHQNTNFWDSEIKADEFMSSMINMAECERMKSSDWWRQVAAIVFKKNKVLLKAYNHHLPTEHEAHYSGDPRTVFKQGQHIDYSIANHAEATLIARAAREGIKLEGAEMLVTTFPCPPCANLISETGIKKLYVINGYSKLDAKRIFTKAGIEVVKIN
jgi:dCMP deaminase